MSVYTWLPKVSVFFLQFVSVGGTDFLSELTEMEYRFWVHKNDETHIKCKYKLEITIPDTAREGPVDNLFIEGNNIAIATH